MTTSELLNGTVEDFDINDVTGIDQETIEQSGPAFPIVQWHYGDPKAKKAGGMDYMGGFVCKDGAIDAGALTAAGWTKTEWLHDSGESEDVWWKREIALSVIHIRKRWEVRDASDQLVTFPFNGRGMYEAASKVGPNRPAGRTHVLCLIKGLETVGPVVLTLKGSAAQYFEGSRTVNGALPQFSNVIIRMANDAAHAAGKTNKWPYRGFWMPVGASRDAAGEPNFIEVGKDKATKRLVVPQTLGIPAKPINDPAQRTELLKRFYVGKANLETVNDLYTLHLGWAQEWDKLEPGKVEAPVAAVVETEPVSPVADAALAEMGL